MVLGSSWNLVSGADDSMKSRCEPDFPIVEYES